MRTYTLTDDGTVIALGFWGEGDVIGQSLSRIQPYEMECLTDVQARVLHLNECDQLNQILFSHLHQTQELLRVTTRVIVTRLLGQFEREGRISWVGQQLLLIRDS